MDRCFYYGCWNQAGHFLWAPGGKKGWTVLGSRLSFAFDQCDGGYAPRVIQHTNKIACNWSMPERDGRGYLNSSAELPQGHYLRHLLAIGGEGGGAFTVVSWWDRNQGDGRGNCSSTILLEGDHTADEVLAAGRLHFPHVFENLKRAGIELVERKLDP